MQMVAVGDFLCRDTYRWGKAGVGITIIDGGIVVLH